MFDLPEKTNTNGRLAGDTPLPVGTSSHSFPTYSLLHLQFITIKCTFEICAVEGGSLALLSCIQDFSSRTGHEMRKGSPSQLYPRIWPQSNQIEILLEALGRRDQLSVVD
jgi:hypothetical protein